MIGIRRKSIIRENGRRKQHSRDEKTGIYYTLQGDSPDPLFLCPLKKKQSQSAYGAAAPTPYPPSEADTLRRPAHPAESGMRIPPTKTAFYKNTAVWGGDLFCRTKTTPYIFHRGILPYQKRFPPSKQFFMNYIDTASEQRYTVDIDTMSEYLFKRLEECKT